MQKFCQLRKYSHVLLRLPYVLSRYVNLPLSTVLFRYIFYAYTSYVCLKVFIGARENKSTYEPFSNHIDQLHKLKSITEEDW